MECLNCSKWIEVDETYFEINRRPWCGSCAKPYIASGLRSAGAWLAKAVLFTVVGASTFALVFSLALGIGGNSATFLGGAGFVLAFVLKQFVFRSALGHAQQVSPGIVEVVEVSATGRRQIRGA
jgi:hypothetical protein